MTFVRPIGDLSKDDVGSAGGKGASLGEMTQAGIPVPGGFVILAETFDAFIRDTGLDAEIDAAMDTVKPETIHTIETASERIEALITNATMPTEIANAVRSAYTELDATFVAVRSSATAEDSAEAAWAGQLETYLNTTENDLLKHVQRCWASLFSPRAIMYRFENRMQKTRVSVAVVIQEMVDSEVSGIAFSVHPVTQDRNQVIIEAGFGLGEAIVSGTITPDSAVIRKDTGVIIERVINAQERGLFRAKNGGNEWKPLGKKGASPALSEGETKELANLIVRIEKHYGFPVDIEWARAKGVFRILQCRPITTLHESTPPPTGPSYEFSWGERHSVMTAEMWLTSYLRFREKLANENTNVLMNVERGQVHTYTTKEDFPAAYDAGKAMLSPKFLPAYLKESANVRRQFSTLLNAVKSMKLKTASNAKLATVFRTYQDVFEHVYALFKISQPEYPQAASDRLREILQKHFANPEKLETAFITLTTPTETDMMKEEELMATELSLRKNLTKSAIQSYGDRYAWFFFNTYDRAIAEAFLDERFRELKAIPEKERRAFLKQAASDLRAHQKKHKAVLRALRDDPEVAYLSRLFGVLGNDRLELKKWWTGSEYLFLDFFEEIARRVGLDVEEYLMTYRLEDTYRALRTGKRVPKNVASSRKKHYAVVLDEKGVRFLEAAKAAAYARKHLMTSGSDDADTSPAQIRGTVANTGTASGIARVIRVEDLKELLKDMQRFGKGEIIVTTMTQPTMASMARKAAAIVTNEGGITSHASILAREFGIPCVVGTKNATQMIRDGDRIEVDANKGTVKVLGKATVEEVTWVHYLTRPFTLLGASFWREWYDTEYILETLGVTVSEARFLEVHPDVVRYYREKRQMASLRKAAKDIVLHDRKKLQRIYDRGHTLSTAARKMLKKGWKSVPDFEAAVAFCTELAIHATVVPFLTLANFDELKIKDAKLRASAEKLRGESLYPRFFAEIVTPHAEHLAKKLGVNPKEASLLTVRELRAKDLSALPERRGAQKNGKRFILSYVRGTESVEWTDDIEACVLDMEHLEHESTDSLQGSVGYRGKVVGKARLVLTDDPKGIRFDAGDILVSINSTPALMPLIVKCAGMVTDEGGISCHAAIVSRELKKPCVIATKIATSVICDGDLLELDANNGVVKILKSRSK